MQYSPKINNNPSSVFTEMLSSNQDYILQTNELQSPQNKYQNHVNSLNLTNNQYQNVHFNSEQQNQNKMNLLLASNHNFQKNIFHLSGVGVQSKYKKQRLLTPELQNLINKIQIFVDDVDGKIQNRVQLVKQVYLNQYRQQVMEMSIQLKDLREKLDSQIMHERANEKMFYLQEERDFFRSQVLKLNQEIKKLNQENKNLKKKVEEEKTQAVNYKQIVYNLESKLLKMKNFNIQKQKLMIGEGETLDLKMGVKTERVLQDKKNSQLETIDNTEEKDFSKTGYRLRPSQSMKTYKAANRYSTPQKQFISTVTYPKLNIESINKIQGYGDVLQRQQIIDSCLNELKKQIYYRNLTIQQIQNKVHFNQMKQIKFEKFTKTDKKQLIIKILSNEKLLDDFYQFLFNKKSTNTDDLKQSKMTGHKYKITDERFNTQMLTNLKTEFNKKIFDIKFNTQKQK